MEFSVYDQLVEKSRSITLPSREEWMQHCIVINSLGRTHAEFLYVLILHHARKHGNTGLPYRAKKGEGRKGAMFAVADLPSDLQRIILAYLEAISA